MRVISVNVGLPRDVNWKGRVVTTGIFKEPISGRIAVRRLNMDGDRQADLTVHGGPGKAIYAYPVEHYDYWRSKLSQTELPWGSFGENLTVSGADEGLAEDRACIGDQFRIGTALLAITQPRLPCYKLQVKFQRDDIIKMFLESGRTGFYLSVVEEGEIGSGDNIELAHRDPTNVTIADITRLYLSKGLDQLRRQAASLETLPANWREYFSDQLGGE